MARFFVVYFAGEGTDAVLHQHAAALGDWSRKTQILNLDYGVQPDPIFQSKRRLNSGQAMKFVLNNRH